MSEIMMGGSIMAVQYVNAGIAHFRNNEFARALAMFDMALRYEPDNRYARYNRSTSLLSLGNYARGFQEYEATWRLFHWRGFGPVKEDTDRLQAALPLWRGERDVRLLVYHEMGFGDAIMAFRFLPEIIERTEMTLVIDPCLGRLAQRLGVDFICDRVPKDLQEFDFRLPLFGVMGALGATVETIPNEPYIGSCKFASGGNRIGIAWSGRTQTAFSLSDFLDRLDHEGATFHALQPGPVTGDVVGLLPDCDFAEVANRIALMDHIVSVDTAAIHLAGAMGHPSAHLVLPFFGDWRWHHAEVWYPTIRTYRQPQPGDWVLPFSQLNRALQHEE